ncbi:MAG: enterochelin esterase [Phycisphaerae bacterium]|nr:enterochelin esterase [Phycisphaerae bacterium]
MQRLLHRLGRALALAVVGLFLRPDAALAQATETTTAPPVEKPATAAPAVATPKAKPFRTSEFSHPSKKLTAFFGRETSIEAMVAIPEGADVSTLPVVYVVHGFGGSHRDGRMLMRMTQMMDGDSAKIPQLLYVFLNATCERGHHEFADGPHNGPVGAALIEEFIPALEDSFGGARPAARRFVTGHSSGGWSSLWLQVAYPDAFGGCWSTAPDPVDFRDWSGVDLYSAANVFVDEKGEARPLVMRGDRVQKSLREYVEGEVATGRVDGQMASFDWVFSPRGADGKPKAMFDRASGTIDRSVVDAWKAYDIGLILRTKWPELAPKLKGKIHVWCGDQDTFRLQGAVKLLKADLAALGSDADVVLVEKRDHSTLFLPHAELWPKGMMLRIFEDMVKKAG